MCSISEQGGTQRPVPSNPDRKSVNRPQDWLNLTVRYECGQRFSPPLKLPCNLTQAGFRVAES